MTQKGYVENMNIMFSTEGWKECWKPRLLKLRAEHVDDMCYNSVSLEEFRAGQAALRVLDSILAIEDAVRSLEARLLAEPAEAGEAVPTE